MAGPTNLRLLTDFFNKIDPKRQFGASQPYVRSRGLSRHAKTARPTRLMWWTVPAPDNEVQ
jgi:hypothetical protein